MRKFMTAFALICTVGAASFLGACSKNSDSGCCADKACCKDKAAVKMESEGAPAANCAKSCAEKANCAKSCSGEKKVCPATGASN